MRPVAVVLTTVLGLAAPACSLFVGLDDLASDVPPADDGGAVSTAEAASDARVPSTPTDAGHDARLPNLHPEGTFDSDCGRWTDYLATLAASDTARSPPRSCRVCAQAAATDAFTADDRGIAGPPVLGARYRAEAWVRDAPGSPPPPSAQIALRTITADPFRQYLEVKGGAVAVPTDGTWSRLEVELTVTRPEGNMNIYVLGAAAPGACFLLDDVRLERLP